jgi:hypothetical protein
MNLEVEETGAKKQVKGIVVQLQRPVQLGNPIIGGDIHPINDRVHFVNRKTRQKEGINSIVFEALLFGKEVDNAA